MPLLGVVFGWGFKGFKVAALGLRIQIQGLRVLAWVLACRVHKKICSMPSRRRKL